jgi:hypothetical protein
MNPFAGIIPNVLPVDSRFMAALERAQSTKPPSFDSSFDPELGRRRPQASKPSEPKGSRARPDWHQDLITTAMLRVLNAMTFKTWMRYVDFFELGWTSRGGVKGSIDRLVALGIIRELEGGVPGYVQKSVIAFRVVPEWNLAPDELAVKTSAFNEDIKALHTSMEG